MPPNHQTVVDFSPCYRDSRVFQEKLDRENVKHFIPKRRGDSSFVPLAHCEVDKNLSGDEKLAKIRELIYEGKLGGIKPSKDQKEYIEEMIGASLASIYGAELPLCIDRLMEENPHWKKCKSILCIVAARREGKTTSVSLFATAMALVVPEMEISIFSTGRRASKSILEKCYKFISSYLGHEREFIYYHNIENLWITPGDKGDIRKINSYPSKVQIVFKQWKRISLVPSISRFDFRSSQPERNQTTNDPTLFSVPRNATNNFLFFLSQSSSISKLTSLFFFFSSCFFIHFFFVLLAFFL